MAKEKTGKCTHPGCECPVPKGSRYCSTYCESAGNRLSIACECGHAECAASETVWVAAGRS
jgi:acetone carboxylase gamma subunit